ncbi:OTU-domain-containing protein [Schizopora paradoxa]|uniref:Ubiquitin thioesterase OTU n=1 Tax=Schizopora paradoxa TaxID=27342 RepID=A0A0H2RAT6_9AGAM|nr:OTU-domain-containing protein [Schizopora paradoxa]
MAPIRIRHPKGASTIDIDLENSTVQDLQQKIREITDILPSQQELKSGFPAKSLTIVPELPLESLGLKRGEQLIVTQKSGSAPLSAPPPAAAAQSQAPSQLRDEPAPRNRGVSSSSKGGPDTVPTDAGVLVHRVVPDDNSCLFSSVALVFEQDISKASRIRQIADAIRKDPDTWNDAILGRSRADYISTILKPSSWGGAIELTILANHYSTEIASIDVETGRIDHFVPSSTSSENRCILIYSGIHYDAVSLAPVEDAPADFHQTVFPVIGADERSDPIVKAATELAAKLRAKHAFTNTSTFDLKCEICKKGLKGEKEARQHASETGHTDFGEF